MNVYIYARLNTSQKVLIPLSSDESFADVQRKLNEKYGGAWMRVDQLQEGEFLKFNDRVKYQGYSKRIDRYFETPAKF